MPMNPIDRILSSVSDERLCFMIEWIDAMRASGVLAVSGEVRALAAEISKSVGVPMSDALDLVMRESLKMAARKWVASYRAAFELVPERRGARP